jgi:ATP-dependent helicase HepA
MTMDMFKAGQRWLSGPEPELGLGLIIEVTHRTLRMLFPAGGDMREYAAASAPLRRARFAVEDQITDQEGTRHTIREVTETDGVLTYRTDAGLIPEAALGDSMAMDHPEQRLATGHTDEKAWFDLRRETLQHRCQLYGSDVRGFLGARIELLPHQLYIAHTVCERLAPRVLLADEVGLGKTIEACLILHRLHCQGRANRILILVPRPLIHQWFVELLRRFNLEFRVVDETQEDATEAVELLGSGSRVICPQELLAKDPTIAAAALGGQWDLLVVDEAHHLLWSPENTSPSYRMVEAIATQTPAVLLLTASPEQTGLESHFARLRLLDPHRYHCLEQFQREHQTYADIAAQANQLVDSHTPDELANLLDCHGPGRVLFRNTRSAVGIFPKRLPHFVPLTPEPNAPPLQPQAQWLASFLRSNPETKVLVICRTRDEVDAIAQQLRLLIQVNTAHFHESMTIVQCDRQAAWFAEPDGARVLIASEIGGEGRNFQFAQHLVLIDLPKDAEALEQRIGRLDRIGQTRDIHIHVPYPTGGPEAQRLRWLHDCLDAFTHPACGAWELQQQFADRLETLDTATIKEAREAHEALRHQMEQGRDRLLELNSCRPQEAQKLVTQIEDIDDSPVLQAYLHRLFDQFGIGVEPLTPQEARLQPEQLFCDEFPLPRDGMQISFDRHYAITRPNVSLLTWDHPVVEGGMDLLLGSERGSCTLLSSPQLHAPVLHAIFVLEVVGRGALPTDRFLPPTPIDIILDHRHQELSTPPSEARNTPTWRLADNSALRNQFLPTALDRARELATAKGTQATGQARKAAQRQLSREHQRIRRLAEENDAIRADEIALAAQLIVQVDAALAGAKLRLDALALILPDG